MYGTRLLDLAPTDSLTMTPSAAAGLRDTDAGAGMGEAVRRVCAMGFPESEARFALEAHSTYEEAIASLLDDGDGVGVALTANPGCVSSALISIGRHLRTPCAPGIFHLHPGFVGLSLATLEM